ncbi:hypothetical protein [Spiroplasma phoeniceum]|uniref:Uncharacterized protein n=1 Tax=Spiroplasma phoeniceum P40 TaxID=1276259 RepID=A0A345DRJ9_9MOLU|nr:hypothetical protein [Spiroplasma phoeniceum]AXF96840.1 hypothetical protein SDAV_001898 [Spiroplasma phoeniceum P40]
MKSLSTTFPTIKETPNRPKIAMAMAPGIFLKCKTKINIKTPNLIKIIGQLVFKFPNVATGIPPLTTTPPGATAL